VAEHGCRREWHERDWPGASRGLLATSRLAVAIVLSLSARHAMAQGADGDEGISSYRSANSSFLVAHTRQAVTYSLAPDSYQGHYVLALQGPGIRELMRKALANRSLLNSGMVESFGMRDADHVTVLLKAPSEGLIARQAGTGGGESCLVIGAAAARFPDQCPLDKPKAAPGAKPQAGFYEIYVNEQDMGASVVLVDTDGGFLFDVQDLDAWRLTSTAKAGLKTVSYEGKRYVKIAGSHGIAVNEDAAASAIHIVSAPTAFAPTVLHVIQTTSARPTPSSYGAFLNYNLSAVSSARQVQTAALLEANAFGPIGTASSSFIVNSHSAGTSFVRLDSYFEKDNPDAISSLRIGDSLTGATDWSLSERFAGVQWASNFATRPDLITLPLQSMRGVASVPSTVELYLNQNLIMRRDLAAGPFAIDQLPVITGNGELRMVVRNALGQQQTIQQPFYADASLLRPGLRSFSYEAGLERRNYGLVSNDYGRPLASGTERIGLSDHLTTAFHGEWQPGTQTLGASASVLLSSFGVLSSAIAGSHGRNHSGGLVGLGFDHHTVGLDFGFRAQATSAHFNQLGLTPGMRPPKSLISAYASVSLNRGGALAFNFTKQDQRTGPRLKIAGLSYNQSLGRYGYLQMNLMHASGSSGGMMAGLSYTLPLGTRSSASVDFQRQGHSTQELMQYQRNAPYGEGIGYRVLAGLGAQRRGEADLTANTDSTSYYVSVADSATGSGVQASATGSIALLGGEIHFARQIPDSFGIVRLPGYPGVRVYEDNQPVGRTDRNGNAFVPNLRSYQDNTIQIDQADLPMDVELATTTIHAVPYARSGLVLRFPTLQANNRSYTLVQRSGAYVPAGSQVVEEGNTYPVGFNGLVYLPQLSPTSKLAASWPGGQCTASLAPQTGDALDDHPIRLECR
jgi:outer membrane usher protein